MTDLPRRSFLFLSGAAATVAVLPAAVKVVEKAVGRVGNSVTLNDVEIGHRVVLRTGSGKLLFEGFANDSTVVIWVDKPNNGLYEIDVIEGEGKKAKQRFHALSQLLCRGNIAFSVAV